MGKKIRASVGEEQNANIKPSMPNDLSLVYLVDNFVFRHGIYGHPMKWNRLFWKSIEISAQPVKKPLHFSWKIHENPMKWDEIIHDSNWSYWCAKGVPHCGFQLSSSSPWGRLALPLSWPRQSGGMGQHNQKARPYRCPPCLDTWWWDACRMAAGKGTPVSSEGPEPLHTLWHPSWCRPAARAGTAVDGKGRTTTECEALVWLFAPR